jgi:branched-chain amino acid transport system substrate-binding protein
MKKHAAVVVALSLASVASAQEVVKIAHVGAVTGPVAYFGKDTENGARMAIEALNARGVAIAGKKVRFELVPEDDAGEPRQATAVAQKLVDAKVNGVVGHQTSGTTIPASKIYYTAGIPQISHSSTSPKYTQQGFNTAFRVVANDSKVGATLGSYAVTRLKARRIAVIDDRTAFGQGLADEFVKSVKRGGGAIIVSRQFTNDKATDFNAILTQVKSQKPDLLFYGGMDAVAGPMLKQMQALAINVPFVSGDGVCSEKLPELAANGLGENRVTCAVAGGVTGAQEKGYADFTERYRKTFKLELQTYAPYAYDAVMVLATAMQKAKSADPARYLPELAKIRYQGVTGTIAFDARGDLRDAAMTLYTYRGGKKVKLEVLR